MEIIDRRSIRDYEVGYKISKKDYKKIFTSAMNAASACGHKPWEFIVVEDRSILDELGEKFHNMSMLKTASAAILVVYNPALSDEKSSPFWVQDMSAATQNILLEAHQLGLGTCWCGVSPKMDREKYVHDLIVSKNPNLLNDGRIIFNVIAIGKAVRPRPKRNDYKEELISFI